MPEHLSPHDPRSTEANLRLRADVQEVGVEKNFVRGTRGKKVRRLGMRMCLTTYDIIWNCTPTSSDLIYPRCPLRD